MKGDIKLRDVWEQARATAAWGEGIITVVVQTFKWDLEAEKGPRGKKKLKTSESNVDFNNVYFILVLMYVDLIDIHIY